MRARQNLWTPLHVAASKGHLDLVKMLITAWSADVDASDVASHTPLIIASCNGFAEVRTAPSGAIASPRLLTRTVLLRMLFRLCVC